jgi:hypothetical protein
VVYFPAQKIHMLRLCAGDSSLKTIFALTTMPY